MLKMDFILTNVEKEHFSINYTLGWLRYMFILHTYISTLLLH